jgi:activator of 2-hydroxyglutaryl-CoA dehydratase
VGGGALNKGLLASLKREIGGDVEFYVPEYPQYVTALGAAIFAGS